MFLEIASGSSTEGGEAEEKEEREEEVGDCGCWCIKGDGGEDTCRDFRDHEPLRHLPNPKVGVSIWGACAK